MESPTVTGSALPEPLSRSLRRHLAERQASWRVPGLVAGIVRNGELVWSHCLGLTDVDHPDRPPNADTAFGIGSITKTFTATLVMALRDEGRLGLDDPLSAHLPQTRHRDLTLGRMLAHASGLQREPVGDIWESLECPDLPSLLAGLDAAEAVLPPGGHWHYSNLAYAVLGEVVARLDQRPWTEALQARILDPLQMKSTSLQPGPTAAHGYSVDPFSDRARPEPFPDLKATAPCGGLWSTLSDLAAWARFLDRGDDRVLSPDTLEEMTRPRIMADLEKWTLAWGLGLELMRSGDRVLVGHTGGMPGFLTAVCVHRADHVGAIVLANSSTKVDPGGLAVELAVRVLDEDPTAPETWRPGTVFPDELAGLTGRWWSEGAAFEFSIRDGKLEARPEDAPADKPPAVFALEGPDRLRTVSGREQGEMLRVVRDESGQVTRMYWATYPFTREPTTFG